MEKNYGICKNATRDNIEVKGHLKSCVSEVGVESCTALPSAPSKRTSAHEV